MRTIFYSIILQFAVIIMFCVHDINLYIKTFAYGSLFRGFFFPYCLDSKFWLFDFNCMYESVQYVTYTNYYYSEHTIYYGILHIGTYLHIFIFFTLYFCRRWKQNVVKCNPCHICYQMKNNTWKSDLIWWTCKCHYSKYHFQNQYNS